MSAPSLPSLLVSHWELQPVLDGVAVLYVALYLGAARRVRRWPARRSLAFLVGVVTVLAALQSGLDTFDDRLLSVHMIQHMLLLLVAPALLALGHPALLTLRALPPGRRAGAAHALARVRPLTGPVVCLGAFYAALLLTHQPGLYDATLRDQGLHEAEHALYLMAGTLLWWPILGGDPVPSRRLGGLGTVVYMLASMPPMALIGALLNRHTTLVYASYGHAGRSLGVSALADQAQAGAIMWVAGNMIMIVAGLWAAVAAMVAEERRTA
ncbi:MAG: cytochrome c oxidase assembly protein, partial [Actinomycetota bacterium]|nr:cytochrome c oxidase assembly protein [Actinomycetota bacterium]